MFGKYFGRLQKNLTKMVLNRRIVYDSIHKSVVTFLIGFTAVGTLWLTYKGFNWYLYKRPRIVNERRRRVEDNVAAEQSEKEKELMQLQKETETMKD